MIYTTRQLFEKSKELWGLDSQFLMLVEESTELALAGLHMGRAMKDRGKAQMNLAEEIADVEFMIEEIKFYMGDSFKENILRFRRHKRKRLYELIREEERGKHEENTI